MPDSLKTELAAILKAHSDHAQNEAYESTLAEQRRNEVRETFRNFKDKVVWPAMSESSDMLAEDGHQVQILRDEDVELPGGVPVRDIFIQMTVLKRGQIRQRNETLPFIKFALQGDAPKITIQTKTRRTDTSSEGDASSIDSYDKASVDTSLLGFLREVFAVA